ncbi:MAG: hypothetical protein KA477_00350 [Candidatus Levybacteria bacterium]|nr:hypothetical protein [Candidatus Levybacteria bacterium]
MSIILYPIFILLFLYVEIPLKSVRFMHSLNMYLLHLLSVPILARTFFKPMKNEYHKGLIVFSVFFGMAIKSVLILISLIIVLILAVIECILLAFYLVLPAFLFYILIL